LPVLGIVPGRAIYLGRTDPGHEVTERERLEREIYELGEIIKANAAALASETISNDAGELLKHQMTRRMAHQKLMQEWLGRLSS